MRGGKRRRPSSEHEEVYHAASRCQAALFSLTSRRLHGLRMPCSVEGKKTGHFASQRKALLSRFGRMQMSGRLKGGAIIGLTDSWADRINAMQKYVFSSTLEKAEWNNSTIGPGDVVAEVTRLKRQRGAELCTCPLKRRERCLTGFHPTRRSAQRLPQVAGARVLITSTHLTDRLVLTIPFSLILMSSHVARRLCGTVV